MNEVVITGIGAMSALGIDLASHIQSHKAGVSLIKTDTEKESTFPKRAGLVPEFKSRDFIKDFKSTRFMTRQVILGLCSANIAIKNAGITEETIAVCPEDYGVIYGAGMVQSVVSSKDIFLKSLDKDGHVDYDELGENGFRNIPPLWILPRLPNTTAGQISIQNTMRSVNFSVVNGVSSGLVSIGEAMEHIQDGRARYIVSGGCEWDPMVDFIASLYERKIASISEHGSASFSKTSDGILCSEGAASFFMESKNDAQKRSAKIYAQVVGYANLYAPNVLEVDHASTIDVYVRAMQKAILAAGIKVQDIDLVHATGNGHQVLDLAEAKAIQQVFGSKTAVNSPMGFIGNTLAASGALNVFYAILQLDQQYVAKIPCQDNLMLDQELSYVRETKSQPLKYVLCNSFDYQGNAVSMVLKRGDLV